MSNLSNDEIRARAIELVDDAGKVWGAELTKAIEDDDLSEMRRLTKLIEDYNKVYEEANDDFPEIY